MKKLFCKFKDGRPQPNLMIEAIEFENHFNVEIWDVFTNYHSCNLFEADKQKLIKDYEARIKDLKTRLTGDKVKDMHLKEEMEEIKSRIGALNKFKNKRFEYSKEEFNSVFEIISQLNL